MLSELGEFVKAPSSTVEPPVVKRFEDKYGADLSAQAEAKAAKKAAKKAPAKKAAARPPRPWPRRPPPSRRPAPAEPAAAEEPSEPLFKPGPRPRKVVEAPPEPSPTSRPAGRRADRGAGAACRRAGHRRRRRGRDPPRAQVPASSPARARPVPALLARATTRSPRPRAWAAGPRRPPARTRPGRRWQRPAPAPPAGRPRRHAAPQPGDDAQVPGRLRQRLPAAVVVPVVPVAVAAPVDLAAPVVPAVAAVPPLAAAPRVGGGFGGVAALPAWVVAPAALPAGDPVDPDAAVPVSAAAPRVPSGDPVAPRAVDASPSGRVVKSSSRWKRRPSAACASARATARPFAWPGARP